MADKIICGCCEKRYEPIFEESRSQAHDCASQVEDGFLVGHYGSRVADLMRLSFRDAPPSDGTIICDACIIEMKDDGRLTEMDSYAGDIWASEGQESD